MFFDNFQKYQRFEKIARAQPLKTNRWNPAPPPPQCVYHERISHEKTSFQVPLWNVLLIEAGEEEQYVMDIPLAANMLQFTEANWKYKTVPSKNYCLGNNIVMHENALNSNNNNQCCSCIERWLANCCKMTLKKRDIHGTPVFHRPKIRLGKLLFYFLR